MPSRQISLSEPTVPSSSPSPSPTQSHQRDISGYVASPPAIVAFSLLLFLITLFRKITRKRTAPADSKPPHRFSYSVLRRATDNFSPSRHLGQGGFGSVFYGTLPQTQKEVAVKLMDSGSLQGEREFQNELFFATKIDSPLIVGVIGFCSDQKRRRMLLVYELMHNGNLQDALLHRKCGELMDWKKRLSVAVDIAKGLDYLHGLDPPVIHGDIKPSNVLLDRYFSARIGDFGLSRLKSESNQDEIEVKLNGGLEEEKKQERKEAEQLGADGAGKIDDCGSTVKDSAILTAGFEEFSVDVDQSPERFARVPISETSTETAEVAMVSPEAAAQAGLTASPSEGNFEGTSIDNGKKEANGTSRNDWWWKQENEVEGNGNVNKYVMEWIGSEIKSERPKWERNAASSSSETVGKPDNKKKKKERKRLEWWMSMEDEKNPKSLKKEKRRPPREWWKEEYCEELARKKKKKKKKKMVNQQDVALSCDEGDDWWPVDEDLYRERKKKSRSRSHGSWSSIDWWLDGLSSAGELLRARRSSNDSASGDIPHSGGVSSTPSMRGTLCYVAPEYGGGGDLSEKCDVYSYGVLLLVLLSGRRPFQVTNSPEFKRANLISWARRLARSGKLIDLVDQNIRCLDRDQVLVCITVALLCLQKLPARRPSMKAVVGMLTGELETPQLPSELSPSPPSRFPVKSKRKDR